MDVPWLGRPVTYEVDADKLRLAREATGLNQKEFAQKLGISPSFLCDLEKGRRTINVKTAQHIAETLKRSPKVHR